MLVSKDDVVRLHIPHEEGEWVDVTKLSWKHLKSARKKRDEEQRDVIKDFGPEFMKAMQSENGEERARQFLKRQQYEESNFDTLAILDYSIIDWSYTDKEGEKAKVCAENVELLDERTASWLKQQVIDLTRPPDEEEEKNS